MQKKELSQKTDRSRFVPLLIVLLALALHLPTLRLGFVYLDDDILILGNQEKLTNPANIGRAFRSDAFFGNLSPYYRPLMNVSFMAEAVVAGQSPALYHFGNVLLHVLTCLALFRLFGLLGFGRTKALAGALVYASHPMMGHAVNWIPARGDLLVALFGVLAFAELIRWVSHRQPVHLILHVICLAAAVFSKESAVLFPFLFAAWLLLRKEPLVRRKLVPLYAAWILVYAGWYLLRSISIDHRQDGQLGVHALLQNLPFLPEAVARFFLPFGLSVTPVFTPAITLAGIVLSLLLLWAVVRFRDRGALPLILFGAAWFLSFCLPNMYVRLESAGDSFEYLNHRTYLPYVGFLILLLALLPEKWMAAEKRSWMGVLAGAVILLSAATLAQQTKYTDAFSYWGSAIRSAPGKAWFHYFMGRYHFKQKEYARFGEYLQRADSLHSYPEFRYQLGMVAMMDKKDYELAYRYFADALKEGYGGQEARDNFVSLCIESSSDLFKRGSYDKAIARCEEALANDPGNAVAAYNLGIYLVTVGEKQRAASLWRRALVNKPDMTEALRSLCLYYQYDVKRADSASWFAREYKKHGGTGNLISPD